MKASIFEIINFRKCITLTILTFFLILLILLIHGGEVFAQTPSMDCDGTIKSWKLSHPNLECSCVNGRPTCDQGPIVSREGGYGGDFEQQKMRGN